MQKNALMHREGLKGNKIEEKERSIKFSRLSYMFAFKSYKYNWFYPLEVMLRCSETQLQLSEDSNYMYIMDSALKALF